MRLPVCAASAAVALALVGCGPETPDYQSIWTTTTTTTTATTQPPVPFSQYLDSIGVGVQQVAPDTLTDLTVSMPTPPGWAKHTSPNMNPMTQAIDKNGDYPTAMLMVFKLNGDFDPAKVVKHANADAVLAQNFKKLDASDRDFHGFPSSMIQGSYDLDGRRLHSYNRVVIATGSPPNRQRYLVQLAVTSLADQAVAQAGDIESIINGFTVTAT
ncbi:MAG: LpqN/LpqT family lipoprotein [Mycobacterium sp.]|nr:LpqN/LpqT family lipoprotein [Mycobacterium sp.]